MAYVFISYSSKDRDVVRDLAEALERTTVNGALSRVWWDRADDGLQAGDDYWRDIADALEAADAAIVLWSDSSLASDWVYSEACRAKGRRKIVPLSIAGRLTAAPPMPFDVLHTPVLGDIRAALPAIVSAIEARIAKRPLVTANGRNIREIDNDIVDLKQERLPEHAGATRPAALLMAKYQTAMGIPFDDVHGLAADFVAWAKRPASAALDRSALGRLVHGAGGYGKTRLMIEVADRLFREGWLAGFVPPGVIGGASEALLTRLITGGQDAAGLFVVVDYAEQRQREVNWLAEKLATRSEAGGRPARLVLLARGAGPWWRERIQKDQALQDLLHLGLASGPDDAGAYDVIEIPHEIHAGDRLALFHNAHAAFRERLLKVGRAPKVALPSDDLTDAIGRDARYDRPLAIQMAALLFAHGYDAVSHGDRIADLLERILGLEYLFWDRALGLGDRDVNVRSALKRGTAQVTLLQGVPDGDRARALVAGDAALAEMKDIDAPRAFDLLGKLFPGAGNGLAALEPDLIGEHHVLAHAERRLVETCLDWAGEDRAKRRQILTVLNRATRSEHGKQAEKAWTLLDSLIATHADKNGFVDDLASAAISTPGKLGELLESKASFLSSDQRKTLAGAAMRELRLLLDRGTPLSDTKVIIAQRLSRVTGSHTGERMVGRYLADAEELEKHGKIQAPRRFKWVV